MNITKSTTTKMKNNNGTIIGEFNIADYDYTLSLTELDRKRFSKVKFFQECIHRATRLPLIVENTSEFYFDNLMIDIKMQMLMSNLSPKDREEFQIFSSDLYFYLAQSSINGRYNFRECKILLRGVNIFSLKGCFMICIKDNHISPIYIYRPDRLLEFYITNHSSSNDKDCGTSIIMMDNLHYHSTTEAKNTIIQFLLDLIEDQNIKETVPNEYDAIINRVKGIKLIVSNPCAQIGSIDCGPNAILNVEIILKYSNWQSDSTTSSAIASTLLAYYDLYRPDRLIAYIALFQINLIYISNYWISYHYRDKAIQNSILSIQQENKKLVEDIEVHIGDRFNLLNDPMNTLTIHGHNFIRCGKGDYRLLSKVNNKDQLIKFLPRYGTVFHRCPVDFSAPYGLFKLHQFGCFDVLIWNNEVFCSQFPIKGKSSDSKTNNRLLSSHDKKYEQTNSTTEEFILIFVLTTGCDIPVYRFCCLNVRSSLVTIFTGNIYYIF